MGDGGGGQRIEVTERETPVFGDTEFGVVGPYERLHGTVFGELDPTHRLNAGIVNLDRAARNVHGKVEYQSDFRILKPRAAGNSDPPARTANSHTWGATPPRREGCRRIPGVPRSWLNPRWTRSNTRPLCEM